MKKYYDRNGRVLKEGDTIDIHQTVNGRRYFSIVRLEPRVLVAYSSNVFYDETRSEEPSDYDYPYDHESLIAPCKFTGESEFEIVWGSSLDKEFRRNKIINRIEKL